MILSSLLVLSALIILARLLVGMAIYAVPIGVGVAAALASHASGAGLLGSLVLGFVLGTAALALAQILVALPRSPTGRLLASATFALPAAAVGYGLSYGLLAATGTQGMWLIVLSLVGASAVGAMAAQRIGRAPPGGVERAFDGSDAVTASNSRAA